MPTTITIPMRMSSQLSLSFGLVAALVVVGAAVVVAACVVVAAWVVGASVVVAAVVGAVVGAVVAVVSWAEAPPVESTDNVTTATTTSSGRARDIRATVMGQPVATPRLASNASTRRSMSSGNSLARSIGSVEEPVPERLDALRASVAG